ncbi:trans-sialidase, putative [Trypanosoma cruzi marinkellei]|uniref:Trans-sialidase, putative n=1 Tax=Trypanosoma cruzi marinkellei TaxID=85056 RepID=K2MR57_TRYCR|nr:trans-sialidase, putative [Trypanosoma cruzi marinkellei]
MLVGKYSPPGAGQDQKSGAGDLGFLLVKGNVIEESGRRIQWKNNTDVSRVSFGGQTETWKRLIGGGGSGVHTKDGRLLFPVEGTKKEDDNAKAVLLLICTLKDNRNSWTLSKWISDGGCSNPSVVEWKDNQLMMMTACDDGRRRVYESGDKGESWTEALGTLSRVWGNKHEGPEKGIGSGFITATIGNGDDNKRKVMLVTLPVYTEEKNKKGEAKLHLWLTDNTHIVDIGPVSGNDDVSASSLLYKSGGTNKEELIALYEKKGNGGTSHSIWSVLLTEKLQRVKDVLATWKKVDGIVSHLCTSTVEGVSSGAACSTVIPTAGLVSFLSGNISETTWMDEYLGVNATVKKNEGAEKETSATVTEPPYGVKFQGAWAEWPVGKQGENQLYHFANYNFTLVATVSIDGDPKEGSPVHLMGVKINNTEDTGNTVLLGLSYNSKGKKWILLCGGEAPKDLSNTWEAETTYHVAIVLHNGTQGSLYVDGQRVGEQCALKNTEDKKVSHFYIGGDGGSAGSEKDVSVTVKNVLLYNRPLDDTEIGAFIPHKASIPSPVDRTSQGTATHSSSGGPQAGQGKSLEMRAADSHGVSTSTLSTATTTSGNVGSVKQLISASTSNVNQSVDGASSPNDSAALGTRVRNAVQGDGSPQTPVGAPATADTKAPTDETVGQEGTAETHKGSASSGGNEEATGTTNGQEEQPIDSQDKDVNATALSSSLGNLSHGNNTDASTVRGSGILPSLLLLMLGLWGFAAL